MKKYKRNNIKEIIIISILTIFMAFMELSGLPCVLFININISDINPIYFALMISLILIGLIAF